MTDTDNLTTREGNLMRGIPFPADDFPLDWEGELEVVATFRGSLAVKFVTAARDRNQHPNDMLADLVEAAVDDNLISSIIDDEG